MLSNPHRKKSTISYTQRIFVILIDFWKKNVKFKFVPKTVLKKKLGRCNFEENSNFLGF